MRITAPITLTNEQIEWLIEEACEHNIDSRITSIKKSEPRFWEYTTLQNNEPCTYDYPLNPLGALVITTAFHEEPKRLDAVIIEQGLTVMAEQYPQEFLHILSDDATAVTADMFLQCCLFGQVLV